MFEDLLDFNKERSPLQALGFYIAFSIFGVLLALFSGAFFVDDFETGVVIGAFFSCIYCPYIAYLILSQKKQLNSAYIALLMLSLLIAYFAGVLGGLIPVSFLSTIKNLSK